MNGELKSKQHLNQQNEATMKTYKELLTIAKAASNDAIAAENMVLACGPQIWSASGSKPAASTAYLQGVCSALEIGTRTGNLPEWGKHCVKTFAARLEAKS